MTDDPIRALLRARIGLDPASLGAETLERSVRRAMSAAGTPDRDAFAARVRRDRAALDALVDEVIVPETWFFRYPESFAELVRLARGRSSAAPLRVLSLPCASGEESYSIVMSLLDAGFDPRSFHVLGVDVSRRAIAAAKTGVYGPNSFRGELPAGALTAHGTLEGDRFTIGEPARRCVRFTVGNALALETLPERAPFDAIFCRNMLIYMEPVRRRQVLSVLMALLAPDGRLFVGHGEPGMLVRSAMTDAGPPAAFSFRRTELAAPEPVARAAAPPVTTARRPAPPNRAAPSAPEPRPSRTAALARAEQLADEGRAEESLAACREALAADPSCAQAYYLLGVVHASQGDGAAARGHLERAVYLDPEHLDALQHLALQAEAEGDEAAAVALRRRAARVRRRRDGDAS